MAVSAAEFWSVFVVQCLAGGGMRSYLSSFFEGSGILEKLRYAIFFFLIDKGDKDSGQPIKQLAENSSDVTALFYLSPYRSAFPLVTIDTLHYPSLLQASQAPSLALGEKNYI